MESFWSIIDYWKCSKCLFDCKLSNDVLMMMFVGVCVLFVYRWCCCWFWVDLFCVFWGICVVFVICVFVGVFMIVFVIYKLGVGFEEMKSKWNKCLGCFNDKYMFKKYIEFKI